MNVRKWLGVALAILALSLTTPAEAQLLASCSVVEAPPALEFGTIAEQGQAIDATTTFRIGCRSLLGLVVNVRVCVSLPAGSGGESIDNRLLISGGEELQYQLYSDSARTTVWGDSTRAVAVDYVGLLGTQVIHPLTAYGRILAGQSGKPVGTYQSTLVPSAKWTTYALNSAPDCAGFSGTTLTVPGFTARATVDTFCKVTAQPLQFGTVSALAGQSAVTNIAVDCTRNGAYSITLDAGMYPGGSVNDRRMQLNGSGPATVEYQLYRDSARTQVFGSDASTDVEGTGTGAPQPIPVYGGITGTGPRPAGTYTDTITVTVSF